MSEKTESLGVVEAKKMNDDLEDIISDVQTRGGFTRFFGSRARISQLERKVVYCNHSPLYTVEVNRCFSCNSFRGYLSDDEKQQRHWKTDREYLRCKSETLAVHEKIFYCCDVCGEKFGRYWVASRHHEEHIKAEIYAKIKREIELFHKLRFLKRNVTFVRRAAVCFRLEGTYCLTPKEIAGLLEVSEGQVRGYIGCFFKYTCLKDKACIFK